LAAQPAMPGRLPHKLRDMAEEEQPLLRVVRGNPTEEELAALVGVVVAASQPSTTKPVRRLSAWTRVSRLRPTLPTYRGPAAWRTAVTHR
jgi:hypothetical protein